MPRDRTKSTLQKVSRDDWNSRQSEGFTRWVNARLEEEVVVDLAEDLKSGVVLWRLVEKVGGAFGGGPKAVSAEGLGERDGPRAAIARIRALANLEAAIKRMHAIGIQLRGVGGEDIYNGNVDLILAMLFAVILHATKTDFKLEEEDDDEAEAAPPPKQVGFADAPPEPPARKSVRFSVARPAGARPGLARATSCVDDARRSVRKSMRRPKQILLDWARAYAAAGGLDVDAAPASLVGLFRDGSAFAAVARAAGAGDVGGDGAAATCEAAFEALHAAFDVPKLVTAQDVAIEPLLLAYLSELHRRLPPLPEKAATRASAAALAALSADDDDDEDDDDDGARPSSLAEAHFDATWDDDSEASDDDDDFETQLFVQIFAARGLSGHGGGCPNPYVVLQYGDREIVTAPVLKSREPKFLCQACFPVRHDVGHLSAFVFSANAVSADDLLGKVVVDLSEPVRRPGVLKPRSWRRVVACRYDDQDALLARHFSAAREVQKSLAVFQDLHRLFRKTLGDLEFAVHALNTPPTSDVMDDYEQSAAAQSAWEWKVQGFA